MPFDEHRARLQHNRQRQTDGYSTEANEDDEQANVKTTQSSHLSKQVLPRTALRHRSGPLPDSKGKGTA